MKKLFLPLMLTLFLSSCEDDTRSGDCPPADRVGAKLQRWHNFYRYRIGRMLESWWSGHVDMQI
jgi:hypothetical protein